MPINFITPALLNFFFPSNDAEFDLGECDTRPIVAAMNFQDKFSMVIEFTPEMLKDSARLAFEDAMKRPGMLAAVAVGGAITFGVVVAAHSCPPVGVFLDAMFVVGLGATGWNGIMAAWSLGHCGRKIQEATNECDLKIAAKHLADAIILLGPDLVLAVLTEGIGVAARGARTVLGMATKAGMTMDHFSAFKNTAQAMDRLVIVRNTKEACVQWIQKGFPPKPLFIKFKNDPETGLVSFGIDVAHELFDIAGQFRNPTAVKGPIAEAIHGLKQGDLMVCADLKVRNLKGEIVEVLADWTLQPGQLLHKTGKGYKPYTGDYDLLDVINLNTVQDWRAAYYLYGQKMADVYYGFDITNASTQDVVDLMFRMRKTLGESRIMHGPYSLFDDIKNAGDCTLFFPDGRVVQKTAAEVRQMYQDWGRPIMNAIPKPM